jgi:hypothetical protein
MGSRAGPDAVVKRKIFSPCRDSNPLSYSPWPNVLFPCKIVAVSIYLMFFTLIKFCDFYTMIIF